MGAFIGIAATAAITLTGATERTLLQLIAPSNHRLKILAWGIYFNGTSATAEPVAVKLLRQTSAGTMSALTIVKADDSLSETLQASATHSSTGTLPTAGDILKPILVHPQTGYEEAVPFGQEYIVGGGDRIGINGTAPATVNAIAWIRYEE